MSDTVDTPGVWSDEGIQWLGPIFRAGLVSQLYCGLFRNDWTPHRSMTIGMVQPANFSGYSGPRLVNDFWGSSWDGLRLTLSGPIIDFLHDAGIGAGFVYGWYLINGAGLLVAARRREPPAFLSVFGQGYRVVPQLTLRTEFGEE